MFLERFQVFDAKNSVHVSRCVLDDNARTDKNTKKKWLHNNLLFLIPGVRLGIVPVCECECECECV